MVRYFTTSTYFLTLGTYRMNLLMCNVKHLHPILDLLFSLLNHFEYQPSVSAFVSHQRLQVFRQSLRKKKVIKIRNEPNLSIHNLTYCYSQLLYKINKLAFELLFSMWISCIWEKNNEQFCLINE